MRKILFRGRSAKNGAWLYGDLIHNRGKVYIADDAAVTASDIQGHTDFEVEAKSVGQYTGLQDADGKDVYEGDILLSDYFDTPGGERPCCEVRWDGDGWSCFDRHGEDELLRTALAYNGRVYANVHDCPALMQEGGAE